MTAPKYAIRRLRPSDYDELLSVWERAGLPARPKGRDSRPEMKRQMALGTSIYLKVVANEPSDARVRRVQGCKGERVQGGRTARALSSLAGTPSTLPPFHPSTHEKIVAVVLGTHDGRKGWINRLAVLPEHRRQGLGSLLVKELERRFGKMGFDIYCGLIETYNVESMAFFAKLGYVRHEDIIYYSKRKSEKT